MPLRVPVPAADMMVQRRELERTADADEDHCWWERAVLFQCLSWLSGQLEKQRADQGQGHCRPWTLWDKSLRTS